MKRIKSNRRKKKRAPKVRLFLPILFFLCGLTISAQSNATISGVVKNAKTNEPVPQVNIYIANSTIGTTTNSEGKYLIQNLPCGNYNLIISSIGFGVIVKKIQISEGKNYRFSFALTPKIYRLPLIVVKDYYDKKWQQNFETFEKQLIGFSENAKRCKILNPFVIEFKKKGDTLIAEADEPLKIENKALGYKITYFLKSFEYFNGTVKFSGLPIFKKLKAKSQFDSEKWKQARLKTYCGSFRHFLTALFNDYKNIVAQAKDWQKNAEELKAKSLLRKEGFKMFEIVRQKIGERVWVMRKEIFSPEIVFKTQGKNEYLLSSRNPLEIIYRKKLEDPNYIDFIGRNGYPQKPVSFVYFHAPFTKVDSRGRYFEKYKMETRGYWAFERLADMLPFDYVVPDSVLIKIDFSK